MSSLKLNDAVQHVRRDIRIGVIISQEHPELAQTAIKQITSRFGSEGFDQVDIFTIPSSFEIPQLASLILDKGVYNLVLAIGSFDASLADGVLERYNACIQSINTLMVHYDTPIISGVTLSKNVEKTKKCDYEKYCIMGLNYLTQRTYTQTTIDARYEELMSQASDLLSQE